MQGSSLTFLESREAPLKSLPNARFQAIQHTPLAAFQVGYLAGSHCPPDNTLRGQNDLRISSCIKVLYSRYIYIYTFLLKLQQINEELNAI